MTMIDEVEHNPLDYAYQTGYNDALDFSDLQGLRAALNSAEQRITAQQERIEQLTAENTSLKRERTAVRRELGEFYCPLYPDSSLGIENEPAFYNDQGVHLATLQIERLEAQLAEARAWAKVWKWAAKFNRQAAEGMNRNLNVALANAARHEKRANELAAVYQQLPATAGDAAGSESE